MNWLEIEQLLERFWEGETSLAEEQKLMEAFLSNDLPSNLSSFKDYFSYTYEQKKIKYLQNDFEEQLSQKLNAGKIKSLKFPKYLAYAAGLLLLMSSLFFLMDQRKRNSEKYSTLTAKEIQVAQKYMGLLASNMEQSVSFSNQQLEKFNLLNKGAETFQPFESTYNKQLKKLNQIDYINQSFTQLKYLKTFESIKIKL